MKKVMPFFLTLLTFFLCSTLAFAFELKGLQPIQPNGTFSGFGTDTIEKGTFDVGIDFERSIDTDYYRTTLKSGYGFSHDAELLMTVPYLIEWEDTSDGFEDLSLGLKHRIFNESENSPSFAYLVKFSLPTGREKFSTDGAAGIGIVIGKKLGPFKSHLNLIYSVPFDDEYDEQVEFIFSVDLSAAHNFDILAELYAIDSYFVDSYETVEGRLGYRIRTSQNIYTLLWAGYDFKNRDPEFRLAISFNFGIGKAGKKENVRNISF